MPKSKKFQSAASRKVSKQKLAPPPWAASHSKASGVRDTITETLGLDGIAKDAERTLARLKERLSTTTEDNRQVIENNRTMSETEAVDYLAQYGVDVIMDDAAADADDERSKDKMWEDVEDQEFAQDIETFARHRWRGYWASPQKTWKERKARETSAWNTIMDSLVDIYLRTKYPSPYPVSTTTDEQSTIPPTTIPGLEEYDVDTQYTVRTYCIWTLERERTFTRKLNSTSPALELMSLGYVAKSPSRPTVAISLRTLQLLYRLRQRKASFSMEAFAKVICDYYKIAFRRHMREVVTDAFEIYLRIRRAVDLRVRNALGWGAADWRVKNACRACCYEVEGELPLRFSRLICMDGNSSLKRMLPVGDCTASDTRVLESDYFLSKEFVNSFAHEVKHKKVVGPQVMTKRPGDVTDSDSDKDGDPADEQDLGSEGDPTDGSRIEEAGPSLTHPADPGTGTAKAPAELTVEQALAAKIRENCVVNWQAASADEKKRTWGIFAECGIFSSACRHEMSLYTADMVRSGELAKYPLAIMSKAATDLPKKVAIGYDIGCDFEKTAGNSSLGPLLREKEFRFIVPAFHGYSHCYPCQLYYHPNIVVGMGLEDLETMERFFSSSNHLASITRYASPYRRRLFIEAYFKQWDEDKNLNLGTFILNNVKQALKIIKDGTPLLTKDMLDLKITEAEMEEWSQEQLRTFATLGEDDYDPRIIAYVELLEQVPEVDAKRKLVVMRFIRNNWNRDSAAALVDDQNTLSVETDRRYAIERFERLCREIVEFETALGIEEQWTPAHPEYQAAITVTKQRRYRNALYKVRGLIIQRLFELRKLNLAQTSYKSRTKLTKALQKRSQAIRTAVNAYNKAAAALEKPRDPLNWDRIAKNVGRRRKFETR
ncbi:hypothetical protein NM688_g8622 [Phlebia brevispora]|uniref:Uncharacterized protein n=1 Tax=Phlebia brevispora TaxID=194682 RepID=A0ACC1RRF8_9APHY|nr:hypothetical protein NM688_g8622 [Phlebia brevispora]